MLKLTSLTLENFGPFKDHQTITFPDDGVAIIYGGNGRGKTHLLNAIRFALFGTILGRGGTAEDLAGFVNREAVDEGKTGFSVTLELNSDGDQYRLTRFVPDATAPPLMRQAPRMTLIKNETALGPQHAEAELGRLLPEQIARFFLFDGELLQQYEELLLDNSDIGDQIKASIERILGVPVLQNAITDISALLSDANREVGRAAEGDRRTRQIGLSLQTLQDDLDARSATVAALRDRIADLQTQRDNLEHQLAGTQRTQRLLGERDRLEQQKKTARAALDEATAVVEDLTAIAWRAVVAPQLRETIGRFDQQIDQLVEQRNEMLVAGQVEVARASARATGKCPICGSAVDSTALPAAGIDTGPVGVDHLEGEIADLRQRRQTLRRVVADDPSDRLAAAQSRLEDAQVAFNDIEAELQLVKENLESYQAGEGELRHLAQRYAGVGQTLSSARDTLETELEDVARKEATIAQLKAQLAAIDTGGRGDAERRAGLLSQLKALFEDGTTRYREQLRVAVEEAATSTFRELNQEPDFVGLRINTAYGLEIVHADGSTVDRRSAGQEHIVALALIAGLQRCAPIRGPIIMDSLFGRLDEDHTRNVVRALPGMARQVVVLVYETELDRQMAIEELGGALKLELQLERVRARHTSIEARTD